MKYKDIIERLSLEEKASLCSGKDFWHMKGLDRLGIPSIMITDGPHGLRKKNPEKSDKIGLDNSVPTTCFPTAATTACSWDRDLLYKMGEALGEECLAEKVSVILGPGTNMKRSPLCGRNFEYFSEDPVLAGEMAASLINGVQSKGVGTSLKHFAANSQETRRMTIDSVVDERALREIYLTAFEIAVKKAQPWTVMNAYNRLNGTYCSDSAYLQKKVLRDEWGFEGIVVTDWGAANDRVLGLKSGNELEMPSSGGYNDRAIIDAVLNGSLDEKVLDEAVDKILSLIIKSVDRLGDYGYDKQAHHNLARKICSESVVLLKNEDNILPLKKEQKIAVIGEMARAPRYQGAGSSVINPTMLDNAFDALIDAGFNPSYAPGYNKKKDEIIEAMIEDAVLLAKKADTVLLFIGLTEIFEAEGYDRKHLKMPESHTLLAQRIFEANKNVIVVLSGGSPMEVEWADKPKAILNAYLGGQASGSGVVDVLTGKVNPSGKLAETHPLKLEDTPCFENYPGNPMTVEYRESVYIGYRYYDTAKKEVLWPFGHGLSYTQFRYTDIKLSKKTMKDGDVITVSYKIKNTGDVAGAEISQVYIKDNESTIFRPEKELKGFEKTWLEPSEEKTVTVELNSRAFAFWNVKTDNWCVESGQFTVMVGASSRDIRLTAGVNIKAKAAEIPDYREIAPHYYTADVFDISDAEFEAVLGRPIPPAFRDPSSPLTILNSLDDARCTKWGRRICGVIDAVFSKMFDESDANGAMVKASIFSIPMRNFITMSCGVFTPEMANGLIMILNGEHAGQGLGKILKGLVVAVTKIKGLLESV